jgi:enoyl-[acyl-carrier protein] reductase I
VQAGGRELAFTYVGESLKERVADLAKEFGVDEVFPCDVADDAQIDALFATLKARWACWTAWCTPSPSPRARR